MELIEELGFDTNLRYIEKISGHLPNESFFTYFYVGEYPGAKIIIEPREVEQAKFFSKEEFEKILSSGEKIPRLDLEYANKFWEGKL